VCEPADGSAPVCVRVSHLILGFLLLLLLLLIQLLAIIIFSPACTHANMEIIKMSH